MKTLLRFLVFGLAAHSTIASRCRLKSPNLKLDGQSFLSQSISSLSDDTEPTTTETRFSTTTIFSTSTTTITLSRVGFSRTTTTTTPPSTITASTSAAPAQSSACSSNLLVNGDFSSDLSVGWTTSGDGVFESLPNECTSPDGNCADFSAGSGSISSISQTLTLETGQTYVLSTIWWQPEQTGPGIVTCSVPGTVLKLGYFTKNWATYTGSFVAQADSVPFICSIWSNYTTSAVGFSEMSVVRSCQL